MLTADMKMWCCLGAFAVLSCAVRSEDFKLADGQVVKGDLSRVEPDGLVLMTDAGVEKVPFLLLPAETQKRYGFDFKKAEEYHAQQTAARQQLLEQQAAAIRERAARLESMQKNQPSLEDQQRRVTIEAGAIDGTALVTRGTAKGAFVKITVQTGRAATTLLDRDTRATVEMGEGFVHDLRAADRETWQGKLYPAGLHTYADSFGVEHTVRAYALTADAALAYDRPAKAATTAERPAEPPTN